MGNPNDISSINLAIKSGLKLHSVNALITKYMDDLEEFGSVRIEWAKSAANRKMKNYWLNEFQAYLLISYMKNTEKSMNLKEEFVKKFISEGKQLCNLRNK